jgi:hypothetical protein
MEKPMGDDYIDPGPQGSVINTTRSNIKSAVAGEAVLGGGGGVGPDGPPGSNAIPGVDVKLGRNPGGLAFGPPGGGGSGMAIKENGVR